MPRWKGPGALQDPRLTEHSKAGAQARFEAPNAEFAEKSRTSSGRSTTKTLNPSPAPWKPGAALTRIFERRRGERRHLDRRHVRYGLRRNPRHQPGSASHPDFSTGRIAPLPAFQEAFLTKDPHMAFCVMIDRNGYLPVHNKIYSHPERPGDVAWNTANSRNRRSSTTLRASPPDAIWRTYLIQSYARRHGQRQDRHDARDRCADPRSTARHWGGFRTAYKL